MKTKQINDLPDDIIHLIKEFIPLHHLVFLNKTYYMLYHYTIKKFIPCYENYIRDVIRRDNDFVFERIVRENRNLWLNMRKYQYKNMVFSSYIYFILFYCQENNAHLCRRKLLKIADEFRLFLNINKKNIIKYIG